MSISRDTVTLLSYRVPQKTLKKTEGIYYAGFATCRSEFKGLKRGTKYYVRMRNCAISEDI